MPRQIHRQYITMMACEVADWQLPNAVILTCAMYENDGFKIWINDAVSGSDEDIVAVDCYMHSYFPRLLALKIDAPSNDMLPPTKFNF